jgi:hypothetical protein
MYPNCAIIILIYKWQGILPGRSKLSKLDIEHANEEEEERRMMEIIAESRPPSTPPSPIVMFGILNINRE